MPSPNTQAIAVYNSLVQSAQEVMSLYNTQLMLDNLWTDQGVATTLAAMTTAPLNSDGTQGANDGAPNSAHPISLAAYPTLSRPLTVTQITQIKTILDQLIPLVGGSAVSAQTGARAILDAAVGG